MNRCLMVERAGVDADPRNAFAPGQPKGLGEKPAAVTAPGKLRDQADERQLALARHPEIELDHADVAAVFVDDRVKLDLRVADDGG
jgi:hypothetical protein